MLYKVREFGKIWFPESESGKTQPFWFRARQEKYKQLMTDVAQHYLQFVEDIWKKDSTESLMHACEEWSVDDKCTLSVMMDQIPRNALAIGYGKYQSMDPLDVRAAIDDSLSLEFARCILNRCKIEHITDSRIVCFLSLVFRHSNDFANARLVLLSLSPNTVEPNIGLLEMNVQDLQLPPLAEKFWVETNKRENSINSKIVT